MTTTNSVRKAAEAVIVKASQKPMSKRGSFQFKQKLVPYFLESKLDDIMFAYDLSKYGHHKQMRDDGTRYFNHPRAVANIIAHEFLVYDAQILIAALLHDVVEDSFILIAGRIQKVFGVVVADIVRLVTKTEKFKGDNFFIRLHLGMRWQAILIKIADRIHNMRTLHNCPRSKIDKQVKETRVKYFELCDTLEKIIPRRYVHVVEKARDELERLCLHFQKLETAPKIKRGQYV